MRERGSAAVELAVGVATLLIPAVVVVISFAPWLDARAFVNAAASEAARAAVLTAGDPNSAGVEAVAGMAGARGYVEVSVEMCGGDRCLVRRGGFVSARVTVVVPLFATPWGEVGGVEVAGGHAEPVDAYRSLP